MFKLLLFAFSASTFTISCSKRPLNRAELKSFVKNQENGLTKRITDSEAVIDIVYWPRQLVLNNEEHVTNSFYDGIDSIDYFLVKFSPKHGVNNHPDFMMEQMLTVGSDTIMALDAVSFNDPGSIKRSIITLVAFKSFLEKRPEKKATLLFKRNDNEKLDFQIVDIQEVNKFSITH